MDRNYCSKRWIRQNPYKSRLSIKGFTDYTENTEKSERTAFVFYNCLDYMFKNDPLFMQLGKVYAIQSDSLSCLVQASVSDPLQIAVQ